MRSVPMLLTAANAGCGLAAIILAIQGHIVLPLWLLLIAALLDAMDGWVARKLKVDGARGANADMVADLLSFGAAPAVIVACSVDNIWTLAAALFYGIMIIVRLARFRLCPEPKGIFLGLPSPVAALPLAAVAQIAMQNGWLAIIPGIAALVFGVLAVLPVRFPAWHHRAVRNIPLAARLVFLFVGIVLLFVCTEEIVIINHMIYILCGPLLINRYLALNSEIERLGEQNK